MRTIHWFFQVLLRKWRKRRPIRIGFWCDYGATLNRNSGIGVFVHNLVEGLLEIDETIEIIMLIHPGEEMVVSRLQTLACGRLRLIPDLPKKPHPADHLLFKAIVWLDKVRSRRDRFRLALAGLTRSLTQDIERAWKGVWQRNKPIAGLLLIGLPIAFLLTWAGFAILQLATAVVKTAEFPVRLLNRLAVRLHEHWQERFMVKTPWQLAQEANCDVWVIPWVAFAEPLPYPSVLLIHDVVTSHFPELFPTEFVSFINRVAPARAEEAVLCACMSAFIRDQDLLGVLRLPSEKVRLVRVAPPRDWLPMSREQAITLKPAQLTRPYLFLPAAIRPAKNQRALIEALRILKDHHGENELDVVFTGTEPGQLGEELQNLVTTYRLQERVHVLGRVERDTLAALFQGAFATIMPSFYEQGSFPVYEALHWQCPVACSDIPSLREQCAAMGEAMLYFDPKNPEDLARTILRIRDNRDEIQVRQHLASRFLWQRTWKDVAREWLAVFKEAAEIGRRSAPATDQSRSAA